MLAGRGAGSYRRSPPLSALGMNTRDCKSRAACNVMLNQGGAQGFGKKPRETDVRQKTECHPHRQRNLAM